MAHKIEGNCRYSNWQWFFFHNECTILIFFTIDNKFLENATQNKAQKCWTSEVLNRSKHWPKKEQTSFNCIIYDLALNFTVEIKELSQNVRSNIDCHSEALGKVNHNQNSTFQVFSRPRVSNSDDIVISGQHYVVCGMLVFSCKNKGSIGKRNKHFSLQTNSAYKYNWAIWSIKPIRTS